eukprot:Gb_16332 [translate_table: standard]
MVIPDFKHAKRKGSDFQFGQSKKQCLHPQNYILCPLSAPMFFANTGTMCQQLPVVPGKLYTFGRSKTNCDIIFEDSRVSRQHCQLYLDPDHRTVFLLDGIISDSEIKNYVKKFHKLGKQTMFNFVNNDNDDDYISEISMVNDLQPSLNGIYVNRSRLKLGYCRVLCVGDQVSLVCDHTVDPTFGPAVGFVVQANKTSSPLIQRIGFGNENDSQSSYRIACRSPLQHNLFFTKENLDSTQFDSINDSVKHDKMLTETETLKKNRTEIPKENRTEILKEDYANNNVSNSSKGDGLLRTLTGTLIEANSKFRYSLLCNEENQQLQSNEEISGLVCKVQLDSTKKCCQKFEPREEKIVLPTQLEVQRMKNVKDDMVKLQASLDENMVEKKQNNSSYGACVERKETLLNFVKDMRNNVNCAGHTNGEETVGSYVKKSEKHGSGTLHTHGSNASLPKKHTLEEIVDSTMSPVTKAKKSVNENKSNYGSLLEEDRQAERLISWASALLRRCSDILRRNNRAVNVETHTQNSTHFLTNPPENAELIAAEKGKFANNIERNSDGSFCNSNMRSSEQLQNCAHASFLDSDAANSQKRDKTKRTEMKTDRPPADYCLQSFKGCTSRVHGISTLECLCSDKPNSCMQASLTEEHSEAMQGCADKQAVSVMGLENLITSKGIQRVHAMSSVECRHGEHLCRNMQVSDLENEDGRWQMKPFVNHQMIPARKLDNDVAGLGIKNVCKVNNGEGQRNIIGSEGVVHGQQLGQTLNQHIKDENYAFFPENEHIIEVKKPCVMLQSSKVENTTSWEDVAAAEHTFSSSNITLDTEEHAEGNEDFVKSFEKANYTESSAAKCFDNPIVGSTCNKANPEYEDGNRQQKLPDSNRNMLKAEVQVPLSNASKWGALDSMNVQEGTSACRNVSVPCFAALPCSPKGEWKEHNQSFNNICKDEIQSLEHKSLTEGNVAHAHHLFKGEVYRMTDKQSDIQKVRAPHNEMHSEILQGKSSCINGEGSKENNKLLLEERADLKKVSFDNDPSSFTGEAFCLNHLEFMDLNSTKHHGTVSLWDLLTPVDSLLGIFSATFTSDILWFLSSCKIPNDLPVTIACHNSERCWSRNNDQHWSRSYPDWPNLTVVYPAFPDAIAFGQGDKRQGVGCHHPKLFLLHRRDSMRVIITSANLVPRQWLHVTNTVWWQDFPRRSTPDYQSLFNCRSFMEPKNIMNGDFAAQLAGFLATLVVGVPSEAHWIAELTHYDFRRATGYLVTSVPGMHGCPHPYPQLPAKSQTAISKPLTGRFSNEKYVGVVPTSVVGLSYRFRATADPKGARMRALATLLSNAKGNKEGMLPVLLKRNLNVPADRNAVSVIVCDIRSCSEDIFLQEDLSTSHSPTRISDEVYVHLGFLCKDAAKWIAPLWDGRIFSFAAYVWPQEVLEIASGRSNNKVQLALYVFQGT